MPPLGNLRRRFAMRAIDTDLMDEWEILNHNAAYSTWDAEDLTAWRTHAITFDIDSSRDIAEALR